MTFHSVCQCTLPCFTNVNDECLHPAKKPGYDFAENGRGPLQHSGTDVKGTLDKLQIRLK